MVTRLYLPHATVVRLHVRKSNVVMLTPETAVAVGVNAMGRVGMAVVVRTVRR